MNNIGERAMKKYLCGFLGFCLIVPTLVTAESGGWRNSHRNDSYWRGNRAGFAEQGSYYGHSQRPASRGSWGAGRGHSSFEQMITQGARQGELSRAEVRELRDKQRDLGRERRRYLADGYLSQNERRELREDYHDLYGDLNHELTDGERRQSHGKRNNWWW